MTRMRTMHSLSLVLILLAAGVVSADDAFYETRLASGRQAYVEKRMPDAATDLRIAAFGFLERPPLLSETLVWLTLAETASARSERVRWAVTRFVEVETKFHPYRQLALDAATRGAFEKVLVATMAPDSLASIPTLADLVRRPGSSKGQTTRPAPHQPVKVSTETKPAPAPTRSVMTQPAQAPPQPIVPAPQPAPGTTSPAPAASSQPATSAPASMPAVVPERTAENAAPPAKAAKTPDEEAAELVEKAKAFLNQNKNDDAFRLMKDLVARTPTRPARKYLLHAATRTHNWQTAVAQIPQIEPFRTGEEVTMFYAAVALYQVGRVDDARPLLERSLPGVNTSPYVESYKQKILGTAR